MNTKKNPLEPETQPWTYLSPRNYSSMEAQDYIEERINQFRGWYDKKAGKSKSTYLWMRTLTVVGGAVVPILINISGDDWVKYFTSVVSLMVVVLVSLESVFHFREQWKNYRSTEQLLAKEYFNFSTGDGSYRDMESKEAFLELVSRIENAIESENASTLNVMTTLTESKLKGETIKKGKVI
jgi:hypothetical protein